MTPCIFAKQPQEDFYTSSKEPHIFAHERPRRQGGRRRRCKRKKIVLWVRYFSRQLFHATCARNGFFAQDWRVATQQQEPDLIREKMADLCACV